MKYYYFSATWCSPCKAMKPLLEPYPQIEHVDVDTEEGSALAGKYSVRGIPTLIATDEEGNQMDVAVGAMPKTTLDKFMEKNS